MPASSNFQQAIREAQSSALVGPNVVNKALPYVGGGMVLTAVGVMGGLSLMAANSALFMPLFFLALIGNLILFFVAQNVAAKGDNATALPLLSAYSLITGFTLSGIVSYAVAAAGVGAVGTAALATGNTVLAKPAEQTPGVALAVITTGIHHIKDDIFLMAAEVIPLHSRDLNKFWI